jgi:PIN domain nuclease of toxin-antitoxin system
LIVLDTHVWVWWVGQDSRLASAHQQAIQAAQRTGIGVSIISCWEVAMLVSGGRLSLAGAVLPWIEQALRYPGVRLLDLTPPIVVDSTELPAGFHKDPADRMLVATARALDCPLITADEKILAYPHVRSVSPV